MIAKDEFYKKYKNLVIESTASKIWIVSDINHSKKHYFYDPKQDRLSISFNDLYSFTDPGFSSIGGDERNLISFGLIGENIYAIDRSFHIFKTGLKQMSLRYEKAFVVLPNAVYIFKFTNGSYIIIKTSEGKTSITSLFENEI